MKYFLAIFFLFLLPSPSYAFTGKSYSVGMMTFGYVNNAEITNVVAWFPAKNVGRPTRVGNVHIDAFRTQYVLPGSYPIIVISHDVAGNYLDHHDMAVALARKGFIVVAPTHNANEDQDNSYLFSAKSFTDRPKHVLRALEIVLASQALAPYADESRIGLLGVGYGSITALQLAGFAPDFSWLEQACQTGSLSGTFCSSWILPRLLTASKLLEQRLQQTGIDELTPPLTHLAPQLVLTEGQVEQTVADVARPPKIGFFTRLFAEKKNDELLAEQEKTAENLGAGERADEEKEQDAYIEQQSTSWFRQANEFVVKNSLNITVYYGVPSTPTALFGIYSPSAQVVVEEKKEPVTVKPPRGPVVYRRAAEERKIRAIALVAPAAGALYSNVIEKLPQPVAIIEAGADEVYAPQTYSMRLYAAEKHVGNSTQTPKVLSLPGVDHYSLFATCPDDLAQTLADICGQMPVSEKELVHTQRDKFLIDFFQTTLGTPSKILPLSRYTAVEYGENDGVKE